VSPLTAHEPEAPVTVQVWEPLAAVVVSVAVTRYEAGPHRKLGAHRHGGRYGGRAGAGTALGAPGVPG